MSNNLIGHVEDQFKLSNNLIGHVGDQFKMSLLLISTLEVAKLIKNCKY